MIPLLIVFFVSIIGYSVIDIERERNKK